MESVLTNSQSLGWLAAMGAGLALLGIVLAPLWAIKLPADFFCVERERRRRQLESTAGRYIKMVLRNLLGCLLILVGVTMLVLPGPGMVAIVIGVLAMDFPGKLHLARRLVSMPAVLHSINWMRRHAGKPPLQLEPAA
ncbi:MAG: hypothetical protein JWP36_2251 [Paucimonas sp.]|nr:hypothetical protein [Paucimonas sp.]